MKLKQFEPILIEEVAKRGLVQINVLQCISSAYHTYSEAAHCNNGHLILRHGDHSDNQIAALVVLLRIQK